MGDKIKTLNDWHRRLCVLHNAHTRCATLYVRRNLVLGVPVVGLSTIVGTSIFATLASPQQPIWIRVIVALLSITAAVLASLQTFLRSSELSHEHKATAVKYGILRREVEKLLSLSEESIDRESLDSISASWRPIEEESPSIPQRIFDLAKTQYSVKDVQHNQSD